MAGEHCFALPSLTSPTGGLCRLTSKNVGALNTARGAVYASRMHDHSEQTWPTGSDFLGLAEAIAHNAAAETDARRAASGKTYPLTLDGLGNVLSLLYRAACCHWGCRGGDHQAEWLVGRAVNQAMASYHLLRSAFYDESLMLTRGIGEIANLVWLFREPGEFEQWRTASRRERMQHFSPKAVRDRLRLRLDIGPPIGDDRYKRLCEVGTHPVPYAGPNLFSGGTRPVLGHIVQPAGVLIAINELAFATAMVGGPAGKFLGLSEQPAAALSTACSALVRSIGNVTIDKYDEITAQRLKDAAEAARALPIQ